MVSLNTIRSVKVRYESEGAEKMRQDADTVTSSQNRMGQAVKEAASATAQAADTAAHVTDTAVNRQISALRRLRQETAAIDKTVWGQQRLDRASAVFDRALGQGLIDAQERDLRLEQARKRYLPGGNDNDPGAPRRLRSDEVTNLMYQGGDIAAQLGSGSPLGMIALQQGPQIAQVFAGPGGASIKGAFAQASEAVGGFLGRIGPAGVALGGVTAAASMGAAALLSYRSAQTEAERTLGALGRTAGVTMGSVNALASAQARIGGLSRREARDIAAGYGGTGNLGSEMIGSLLASTREYARLTGQELPDAAKEFGSAFAEPSKGAELLNQRLAILNGTQLESVQRLEAQGNRLGAQRALLAAYRDGISGVATEVSAWGRIMTTVGDSVSNLWDRLGRTIEKSIGGGTLEQRLGAALKELRQLEALGPSGALSAQDQIYNFGGSRDDQVGRLRNYVQQLQDELRKRDATNAKGDQNRLSTEITAIVRGLDPSAVALERIQDSAQKIRSSLSRLPLDEQRAAQNALDGMVRSSEVLRDNMKAGGEQFASSLRQAQFENRTVGFSGYGRDAARLEQDFAERRLKAFESGTADQQARALRKLEEERRVRMDTMSRNQTLDLTQGGGAFARAPVDIQRQILEATARFGTVDPAILAAIGEKENGFRLSGPTNIKDRFGNPASTAYGYGQITVDAETDIRKLIPGFDRKDPNQAVMGAAAYLSLRQKWAGGDLTKALDGYGTGPGYGIDIQRRAGQLGDASSLGVAKELDAQTQAVERSRDALRITTEMYGRNGAALEASTRAGDLYREMLARGVAPSDALRKSLEGLVYSAEEATRATRLVQFARDDDFARDQLGRSRIDQQAYATARSLTGDVSSDRARLVIDRTRDTLELSESRAMLTDGVTSFVTDLRRGGDAATALSNAFGNAADRLIAKVMDSAISSAFGAVGGGSGGGIGGVFSSLFGGGNATGATLYSSPAGPGFSAGGYTGAGGRLEPAGIVHKGEMVWSQADVARVGGVGIAEAIRRGLPGYAAGGPVGAPAWMPPPANAATGRAPAFNFIDQRPAGSPDIEPTARQRPDGGFDVIVRSVEGRMGQRAAGGQGPFKQAAGGAGYRNG
jgi:phage-related minor tail protein